MHPATVRLGRSEGPAGGRARGYREEDELSGAAAAVADGARENENARSMTGRSRFVADTGSALQKGSG